MAAHENRNDLRKKIENYSYGLNDHLDRGHKSNIFKGLNELTEERVAIKVVSLRSNDVDTEQLNIEIQLLKNLRHPNLIHCHDVYSTVNNCYIITEFCEQGDLQNRINTRGAMSESEALIYFKDILSGFLYIVQEKYIHGGFKLSSLLLKEKVVKIGGFANARKVSKDIRKEVNFNPYQSPESAKENVFNHKTDIWSLGIILYVLLHGTMPWEFTDKAGLLEKVGKPFHINKELKEDTKDFLKRTLTVRENRLSLEEMTTHSLLKRLIVGNIPIYVESPEQRREKGALSMGRLERQINAQINWMRFLFRLIQRILNQPQEIINTLVLKFIIARQQAVQFQELKRAMNGQNPFGISIWPQFLKEKDKVRKYKQILRSYEVRFEKILPNYRKYLEKLVANPSVSYLTPIFNQKFILSEFNTMVAIKASLEEIRNLWNRITKEYPPKGKYDHESPFRWKRELLLLDFLVSYYQLNCLLLDDFHRLEYFEKNSKLEIILDTAPVELDATNLEEIQFKLMQLTIIP